MACMCQMFFIFNKKGFIPMNIASHPLFPHRKLVQLRVTDKVPLASLLFFAVEHAIVDGPPKSENSLIWVRFGRREPTAFRVGYLRRYTAQKAVLCAEEFISIPETAVPA